MGSSKFIAAWNGSESNFRMSYEALSTYIREETSVFLQVCCAKERDVMNRECVGELIVNIGGLRRHLLPTATLENYLVESANILRKGLRMSVHPPSFRFEVVLWRFSVGE